MSSVPICSTYTMVCVCVCVALCWLHARVQAYARGMSVYWERAGVCMCYVGGGKDASCCLGCDGNCRLFVVSCGAAVRYVKGNWQYPKPTSK